MTTASTEPSIATEPDGATALPRRSLGVLAAIGVLVLLMTAGMLITYKAAASLKVLAKAQAEGTLGPKARWIAVEGLPAGVRPLVDSLNYMSWVLIALSFGVVIGAMVRAFVPSQWLQRTVAVGGLRGQVVAALVGAPLMLCSCCVAPVFEGVYERTRRLGPALGLMLAAPALNPAVLAITFLLFPGPLAWTRLGMSALLVVLGSAILGRVFPDAQTPEACPVMVESPSWGRLARGFASSLRIVAWRTLPAIVVGVLASAAVAGLVPIDAHAQASGPWGPLLIILVVTLVALPLALPTFGEVPIALALLGAGAPAGAAAAVLIAGPAINLPSLLTLGRATSWRVAAATAGTVLFTSLGAGAAVTMIHG